MKPKCSDTNKYIIPAVSTTMELLRLLAESKSDTTTKELAYTLGVPRTTCYRILRTLIQKDWIRPVAGGRHELSLGLLPMMNPLRQVEKLAGAVQPLLEALAKRTQLTTKVSVRQGDHAVTVARCESPQETSIAVRQGASFHLAVGSSGTVLLGGLDRDEIEAILERAPEECWANQTREDVFARLKEYREQNWSADLGVFRPSLHAISVPLRDARDEIVAAMTVIGFPHELPPDRLAGQLKLLADAARRAEKAIAKLTLDRPAPARKPANGTRRAKQG